jgi:hypothetical protein
LTADHVTTHRKAKTQSKHQHSNTNVHLGGGKEKKTRTSIEEKKKFSAGRYSVSKDVTAARKREKDGGAQADHVRRRDNAASSSDHLSSVLFILVQKGKEWKRGRKESTRVGVQANRKKKQSGKRKRVWDTKSEKGNHGLDG